MAGGMKHVNAGKWLFLAQAVFWAALAFTLTMALLPKPPALPLEAGDKTLHMIAFAILSLLATLSFPRRRVLELFVWMAALGALIEVLQMIPALHRDAELGDWVADCLASLVALVLSRLARWLFEAIRA